MSSPLLSRDLGAFRSAGTLLRHPRVPLFVRTRLAHRLRPTEVTTWPSARAAILERSPERLTVDIFDTAIFRDVMGDDNVEEALCEQLGAHNAWSGDASDFKRRRSTARSHHPGGSVDAWTRSEHMAQWVTSTEDLLEHEAEIECNWSNAAPGAVEALNEFRDAGIEIGFVSDMHLTSLQLRPMLEFHGLIEDDEKLWVSCEHGTSKHEGGLWPIVAGDTDPAKVIHIGNNRWADVSVATAHGIATLYYPALNPTAEEEATLQAGVGGGMLAASLRRARLGDEGPAAW